MSAFLTTLERFTDEHGIIRHAYVSWPVWNAMDGSTSFTVKDENGLWFTVEASKAIFSPIPTKTANLSDSDYVLLKRDNGIRDFNKAYKDYFGVDVSRNQYPEYQGKGIDDETKKEMINEDTDSQEAVAKSYRRNLYIQP